jgi:hypothetical protein
LSSFPVISFVFLLPIMFSKHLLKFSKILILIKILKMIF